MMYDELIKRLRDWPRVCTRYDGSVDQLHDDAADAIEELQGRAKVLEKIADKWCEAVPKWIPVTERLPEDGADVLITWVNHSPSIYYQHLKDKPQAATGVYYRKRWYWWSTVVQDYLAEYGECEWDQMDVAIEVTHWMPLPEPPKEVET